MVSAALASRLEAALAATRLAAAETLRWFGNPALHVTRKADDSPVTQADRAAEALARTRQACEIEKRPNCP